jgi:hypothetical protein
MNLVKRILKNENTVPITTISAILIGLSAVGTIAEQSRIRSSQKVNYANQSYVVDEMKDGSTSIQVYPFGFPAKVHIIDTNHDGQADIEFTETYASSGARAFPFSYTLPVTPDNAELFSSVMNSKDRNDLIGWERLAPCAK